TLLIFSEGLYREPMGATSGEFQALARAVLFAMALILAAAWKDIQPLAAIFTTATSLIALMVWRRFAVWQQKRGRPVSRNVLMVGCGPPGRAIAQALREDPLHLPPVRGSVDAHTPLSQEVLGRIEDLEWLARVEFVDEVIVALPSQSILARQAAEVA